MTRVILEDHHETREGKRMAGKPGWHHTEETKRKISASVSAYRARLRKAEALLELLESPGEGALVQIKGEVSR